MNDVGKWMLVEDEYDMQKWDDPSFANWDWHRPQVVDDNRVGGGHGSFMDGGRNDSEDKDAEPRWFDDEASALEDRKTRRAARFHSADDGKWNTVDEGDDSASIDDISSDSSDDIGDDSQDSRLTYLRGAVSKLLGSDDGDDFESSGDEHVRPADDYSKGDDRRGDDLSNDRWKGDDVNVDGAISLAAGDDTATDDNSRYDDFVALAHVDDYKRGDDRSRSDDRRSDDYYSDTTRDDLSRDDRARADDYSLGDDHFFTDPHTMLMDDHSHGDDGFFGRFKSSMNYDLFGPFGWLLLGLAVVYFLY